MPDQSELDAQFNESDLERRVQDLETKLSQYEQGGFDLFRQFGYLQLGLNLPRLDQNGIQQVATAAGSAGIGTQGFWIVPKFSPKPGQINETSPVMPRSGLTGYADSATPRAAMYMASDGVLNETSARVHTKADNSGAEAGLYAASTDGMTNLSIALTLLALDSDSTAGRLTLYDAFMNFATVAATFANPSEGDIWYDTTANKFYGRNNSATLELGGSSGMPMPPLVGTENWHCLGTQLAASAVSAPISAAWPAANRALYIPIIITEDVTVVKLWVYNGATASGNIDMAIYNSAFARQVTIGSTAQAGTNVIQEFNITDTALTAGTYYIGIAMDNTTGTTRRYSPYGGGAQLQTWGMAQEASAFALPSTATPADVASAYIPICGIATRTQVA